MHVLFLTPWYPNRRDAMDGIFVRKHAQAVRAQGAQVSVIRVRTDDATDHMDVDIAEVEGVLEVMVYTPVVKIPVLKHLSIAFNFVRGFARAYKVVAEKYGKPDVTQVNVLTRMGVMAWALKKIKGIPYVIIEHWGRYVQQFDRYEGFLRKRATELACRGAECVMPVSEDLVRAMRKCGLKAKEWKVVNNVVNDFFFTDERSDRSDGTFHLICVTTPDDNRKNNSGLVRAFAKVAEQNKNVRLTIVGLEHDTTPKVGETVDRLGLNNVVSFAGEVPPEGVSKLLHQSDALALFTYSENAPCVISEALACGLPVISTPVGGIPEMVSEKTGILVTPGDEEALASAIESVANGNVQFNREDILNAGRAYSYQSVGRFLMDVYTEAIKG